MSELKYIINQNWLKEIGFNVEKQFVDDPINKTFYYNEQIGDQSLCIKLWVNLELGIIGIQRRFNDDDFADVIDKIKITNDDELYFIMSRLPFINSSLKLYNFTIQKP